VSIFIVYIYRKDVKTAMIYTHVLNRGGRGAGVRWMVDCLEVPSVVPVVWGIAAHRSR
jgi:hypothetical protein